MLNEMHLTAQKETIDKFQFVKLKLQKQQPESCCFFSCGWYNVFDKSEFRRIYFL